MFNLFSALANFFKSLFGKNADVAQRILKDASVFVNIALPIVEAVEAELKTLPQTGAVGDVTKFLNTYIPDVAKSAQVASTLSALPAADLWRNVAVTALGAASPPGTASSLLNLAIELAYNIFKSKSI